MTKAYYSLSAEQLATLFTQLKSMELAALPAFQAIDILRQSEARLRKPLAAMQQQLTLGRPISEAGFKAGIFNEVHKTLIHAAESSGRLAEVYGRLASHYAGLSGRIKKIKSRLTFPALTLIISLFIQPLPALVSSEISGFDYIKLSAGRILVMGIGLFLLIRLPMILRGLGAESDWHRLQLKTPVVGKWIIKRQVNEFFAILAMMLEGGVPFSEALPKAVASVGNGCLREQFSPAIAILGSGASVADTFSKVPVINATWLHRVNSSERSGKLASGILQFTQMEAQTISLQDNALAEWLPRLVYGMIAIWLAYSILRGQFAPLAT
ncbi:MAG: type II secretion system F family protein [Burkholderiales bacterium]